MEQLTTQEVRVLGALIEKEFTTPEYYPLTLNALTNACNQKSNRDPVVSFTETETIDTIEELRLKGLAAQISGPDMRVPRYRENIVKLLNLTQAQTAALCVLMLRGPQTVGEIKGRSGRIFEFASLQQAEETLNELMTREPNKLVARLPRQPGKDARYMHLFSGEPQMEAPTPVPQVSDKDRITQLEQEVAVLKDDMTRLRGQFADFKKQFE